MINGIKYGLSYNYIHIVMHMNVLWPHVQVTPIVPILIAHLTELWLPQSSYNELRLLIS